MDIKTATISLLILGLISLYFTIRVLIVQVPLLRTHDNDQDRRLRFLLFYIALTLLAGNLIFLAIDIATIFASLARSTRTLNTIGVVYSFAMSLTHTFATGFLWMIYKLIGINNAKLLEGKDIDE